MKKIVLASAAMGGAALLAFGASGTFAAFSDQVSSNPSSARAGTMYLANGETKTSEAELSNLAPGDAATYAFFVQNQGTIDGTVTGAFRVLSDDENYCYPVEDRNGSSDPSCTTADQSGELDDTAIVTASYGQVDTEADCTTQTAQEVVVPAAFSIRDLSNQAPSQPVSVPAGDGFCAVVTVTVPLGATNNIQSDSTSFGIDYTLVQATSQG